VHFWNIATGHPSTNHETLVNPTGSLIGIAFSPDGATLGTGSNDNGVRLWNSRSGELIIKRGGHTHWVSDVAFSPTHAMLASASKDGTVRLWALAV
jgi:WD40 repeat protein